MAHVDETPITQAGLERLHEELADLVDNRRPAIASRIKAARELGDLKENADYHDAKNEQAFIESKIRRLEASIRTARVVEATDTAQAGIGTTVTVVDVDTGERETWQITGTAEADPLEGRVSTDSPIGSCLVGAQAGDEVVAALPRGERRLRVESIALS